MSEQTNLEMKMGHVSQAGNSWTDDNLVQKDVLRVKNACTEYHLRENDTVSDDHQIELGVVTQDHLRENDTVSDDHEIESAVATQYHLRENNTVSDDHQTEHGVITEYHLHENDTMSDDHQTEHGVITEYHLRENDTVSDVHQIELGVVTQDHLRENDTVSDDHQIENAVVTQYHLRENDTMSDDHQTEHGVITEYHLRENDTESDDHQIESAVVTQYHLRENDTMSDDHQTEHGVITEYHLRENDTVSDDNQIESAVVTQYHLRENNTVSDDHQTEHGVITEYHLRENDTVSDDHQIELGVVTQDHLRENDTVSDDHQIESGVITEYHLRENDTVPDDHQIELGVVTQDHLRENYTVSDDHQIERGVITEYHLRENDTVSDVHQIELGVVTQDHLRENDTVSDDHQIELGVVTEDHLHEYDTVSNDISVGAYHVTDEGDIAFMELFSCIGKPKRKNKATTPLEKIAKDKARNQQIDQTLPTELKNLDTKYECGVKPRHPYIQIVRNGGGHSSDIIGGCTMKGSAGASAQVPELKHGNVTADYEKQASLSRASVEESWDRHHPANTSALSHHTRIHDLDKYDFSFPHRGYAVLIVNKRFTNFSTRDGAQFDVTKSKDILQKLGYYQMNNECKNLDKASTLKILKAARDTDHSIFDSFALIVSSHGDEKENPRKNGKKEHAIYCTDDQYIFTGDILEMFSDDNCTSLKGKPKLFFIQACRGSKTDLGAEIAVIEASNGNTSEVEQIIWTQPSVGHKDSFASYYDGKNPEGETMVPDQHLAPVQSVDDTDAGSFVNIWEDRPIVHCNNDCLIMYAIPSGHFAWRSNTDGSWMLHYLWGEVMNYDYRKPCSFLKVLTATNRKMANRETHTLGNPAKSGKKAIPAIIHQLDKDIVFRQKKYSEYSTITFV